MSVVNAVEVREINEPEVGFDEDGRILFERHDGIDLSPAEIAFVEFYCGEARFRAADAYAKAMGITKTRSHNSVGFQWVKKPYIQKAIKWRLDAIGATQSESLAALKEIAMSEWQDHVVIKMRNGEEVEVKMDLMPIVRANEIILRAHGALDNKTGVTVPIQININTNIPEEDLA